MKSNVCKIDNGIKDLEAILAESEKIAAANNLGEKQTLQLRLLCEEVDGMLPKILGEFDGDFWIEFEDGICKLNALIEFKEFTVEKKAELISVATNKKNAAVKGLVDKIWVAIMDFFLEEGTYDTSEMPATTHYIPTEDWGGVVYYRLWGLEQYKSTIKQEDEEAWDELEKSIIASIADDVIVGVRGKKASIVIVKKFA